MPVGSSIQPTPSQSGDDTASVERYRPGYELVAEKLLQYMAEENLRPGDRLPTEQGLAELLDTTRNVTREAVKVLAAMGRLTVRKGAGIFVAANGNEIADELLAHFQPTAMEQVLMLLDYRRLIESDTARRAANLATPIQVRAVRQAAEDSRLESTPTNRDDFAKADALFHDSIAIAAGNVFLQSNVVALRRYAGQSDLLLFHGDVTGSFEVAGEQHIAIANAIASGDSDLSSKLMIEHIDTVQHQFERKIRDRLFNFDRKLSAPLD
jgi:DNA-binding FadR family transcriptional regulator